ncbi:hypothetical protein [Methanosarcina horonobensis]|nr:hypothetical protein [Methanosarcina horonobensis]
MRGFELLFNLRISSKLTLSMMGYIIIRRTIATGIETFAISSLLRESAKAGKM